MLFLYAIIAMFCWSGSDLFSKMGTKLNDKFSHLKVGIAVGLIMGFHAIYEVTFGNIPLTLNDIWIYGTGWDMKKFQDFYGIWTPEISWSFDKISYLCELHKNVEIWRIMK